MTLLLSDLALICCLQAFIIDQYFAILLHNLLQSHFVNHKPVVFRFDLQWNMTLVNNPSKLSYQFLSGLQGAAKSLETRDLRAGRSNSSQPNKCLFTHSCIKHCSQSDWKSTQTIRVHTSSWISHWKWKISSRQLILFVDVPSLLVVLNFRTLFERMDQPYQILLIWFRELQE